MSAPTFADLGVPQDLLALLTRAVIVWRLPSAVATVPTRNASNRLDNGDDFRPRIALEKPQAIDVNPPCFAAGKIRAGQKPGGGAEDVLIRCHSGT